MSIYVNLDVERIIKIEVEYHMQDGTPLTLQQGQQDPTAVRWYQVYIPGDRITVVKENGEVYSVIERIIKLL